MRYVARMAQLYHVTPECDLLAQLAQEVALRNPQAVLLLPNHRAVARYKQLMMVHGGLLPRVMTLGELDELWLLQQAMQAGNAQQLLSMPKAADSATYQLQLAHALQQARMADEGYIFEHYVQMASAIWQAFEQVEREGKPVELLNTLAKADISNHWQQRVTLLRFAAQWWERYQKDKGIISSTKRRNLQAQWLAQHWAQNPPQTPVVIAGSTGSQASTLQLMQAVLALPEGQLWLQGMDTEAFEKGGGDSAKLNEMFLPSQPQNIYARLKQQLPNVAPQQVGAGGHCSAALYVAFASSKPEAMAHNICRIHTQDEEQEARLVALLTREVLQQKDQKVAIIVPAAQSAKRVQGALKRYGIVANSAVGEPLALAPPTRVAMLVLQCALNAHDSVSWLALMKLANLAEHAEVFECKAIRGKLSSHAFLQRLQRYLTQANLTADAIEQLDDFVQAMQILLRNNITQHRPSIEWFEAHMQLLQHLSSDDWTSLHEHWSALRELMHTLPSGNLEHYQSMLGHLLAQQKYFPNQNKAALVNIYSPIEARMMRADRAILCGLNEGSWPAKPAQDAWLHPQHLQHLGLAPPDAAISLSAHDFICLSGMAKEVFWLRPNQSEGAEQLPARWLERFASSEHETQQAQRYRQWLQAEYGRIALKPIAPPAPTPPAESFPQDISVSSLELLLRNPYGFYAKMQLGLRALEPIDRQADASHRGQIIHKVMELFVEALNAGKPLALSTYEQAVHTALTREDDPLVLLQWKPRMLAMAQDIMAIEAKRREQAQTVLAEQTRHVMLRNVKIEGRIDRLEILPENAYAVIDYKTGSSTPTKADIMGGFAPQLPVLAAMVDGSCSELAHWTLSGVSASQVPVGNVIPNDLIDFYIQGIGTLLERYVQQGLPFYATPQPEKSPRYNDYDHLARTDAWTFEDEAA